MTPTPACLLRVILVGVLFTAGIRNLPAATAEHNLSEEEIEQLQAWEKSKIDEVRSEIAKINEEAKYEEEKLLSQIGDPPKRPINKGIGAGSGVPTAAVGGGAMGAGLGAAAGSFGGNAGYGAAAGALAGVLIGAIMQASENSRIQKQVEQQYQQEMSRYQKNKKAAQERAGIYRKSLLANYRAKLTQAAAAQKRRLQQES